MSFVYRTGYRNLLLGAHNPSLTLAVGAHDAGFPSGDAAAIGDLLLTLGDRRIVAGGASLSGLLLDVAGGRLRYQGPAFELPQGVWRVALSDLEAGGGALGLVPVTLDLDAELAVQPLSGGQLGLAFARVREQLTELFGVSQANAVLGDEPVELGLSLDLGAVRVSRGTLRITASGSPPVDVDLVGARGHAEDAKLLGLARPVVAWRIVRGLAWLGAGPDGSAATATDGVLSVETDVLDPGGGDVIEDHVAQAAAGLLHRAAGVVLTFTASPAEARQLPAPAPWQPTRPLLKLVWDGQPTSIVERKLVQLGDGERSYPGLEMDLELPANYGEASRSQAIHPVVVVRDEDHLRALGRVLDESGFDDLLRSHAALAGVTLDKLRIAVKPNFMFMYSLNDRSTFTDPALVLALIDRLARLGCKDIAIVEAESLYGNYVEGRTVRAVAEYLGYKLDDPRYRVVSLTEEMVPYDYGFRLGEHWVGPTWRDAQFRVSFAKNKTHTFSYYTLCIKNTYGCLPLADKLLEYHAKRAIEYPTIDALRHFPVHYGVVDATLSSDGNFGIFADREPKATHTVFGGDNIVAVDWVGARKMGMHPMVSEYMREAAAAFGKPEVEWLGDHSVYPDFRLPWRATPEFWNRAHKDHAFTDAVFRACYAMDEHFPRRPEAWWQRLFHWLGGVARGSIFQDPRHNPPAPAAATEQPAVPGSSDTPGGVAG